MHPEIISQVSIASRTVENKFPIFRLTEGAIVVLFMKFIKDVAKPKYLVLTELFEQRFDKVKNNKSRETEWTYRTELSLKINLRFETNISFPARLVLIKKGVITRIRVTINQLKIILISIFMFGLISLVYYLIHPSISAFIFGLIAGIFVYFLTKIQVVRAIEIYLNTLINIQTDPDNK